MEEIMALSRKMLKAMGIGDEQIDEIIAAHSETVEALKEQRDNYKLDADKLPAVTAERDELKNNTENDTWKTKYDEMKSQYSEYKEQVKQDGLKKAKETAYRALLSELKISPKRFDAITKISNLDSLELDDKGNIKDKEKISTDLKTEWADFIESDSDKIIKPETPPQTSGGTEQNLDDLSDDEFYAQMKKDKK